MNDFVAVGKRLSDDDPIVYREARNQMLELLQASSIDSLSVEEMQSLVAVVERSNNGRVWDVVSEGLRTAILAQPSILLHHHHLLLTFLLRGAFQEDLSLAAEACRTCRVAVAAAFAAHSIECPSSSILPLLCVPEILRLWDENDPDAESNATVTRWLLSVPMTGRVEEGVSVLEGFVVQSLVLDAVAGDDMLLLLNSLHIVVGIVLRHWRPQEGGGPASGRHCYVALMDWIGRFSTDASQRSSLLYPFLIKSLTSMVARHEGNAATVVSRGWMNDWCKLLLHGSEEDMATLLAHGGSDTVAALFELCGVVAATKAGNETAASHVAPLLRAARGGLLYAIVKRGTSTVRIALMLFLELGVTGDNSVEGARFWSTELLELLLPFRTHVEEGIRKAHWSLLLSVLQSDNRCKRAPRVTATCAAFLSGEVLEDDVAVRTVQLQVANAVLESHDVAVIEPFRDRLNKFLKDGPYGSRSAAVRVQAEARN